jgi:hypothetical protein
MSLLREAPAADTPTLTRATSVRLVPAAPALWRIIDGTGRVIGHLQAVPAGRDLRYRARRFHARSRAFRDIGEFWSADDAIECVRLAR